MLRRVWDLANQTDKLKLADLSQRASRKQREETVFNVGRMAGIKDCIKNACKKFPQVSWAEQGVEAVEALKDLEAEKALKTGLIPQPEKTEDNTLDAQASDAPADEPASKALDPAASLVEETPSLATPDGNLQLSSSTTEPPLAEKSQ